MNEPVDPEQIKKLIDDLPEPGERLPSPQSTNIWLPDDQ